MHKLRENLIAIIIILIFFSNIVSASTYNTYSMASGNLAEIQNGQYIMEELTNPAGEGFTFKTSHAVDSNSGLALWETTIFGRSDFSGETDEEAHLASNISQSELVIGLNSSLPDAYEHIAEIVTGQGGSVISTVSILNKTIAIVVDLSIDIVHLLSEARITGIVRYIEPRTRFQIDYTPSDSYWNQQWGPRKISADWAWNTTFGSNDVIVAVIDTGIDYTHPDLAPNYVPLGRDWANNDNDPLDDHGHGTHCAGIIAASIDNAVGVAGIANASVMAEKALDSNGFGWDDNLASAIIHAVDQGANILSNSWGGDDDSQVIRDAIQYAHNQGALVLAAAGNTASNSKHYPAAYQEVVAITATDSNDSPAGFTTYGDWVELAAPGVNIYSTLPTYQVKVNDYGYSQNYSSMSGTSMACPHVAGTVALIWSQFPSASSEWVRHRLRVAADDLGNSGFDEYFGHGRINARRVIEEPLPDHELIITGLSKPKHVQPSDYVLLNASVFNFGLNEEQNVTAQLVIDGSVTDSKTIDSLPHNGLITLSFTWNPLFERTYNITVYVIPAAGETSVENNAITMFIPVAKIIASILFEQTRCDPIGYYSTWVESLEERGYIADVLASGTVTPQKLETYDIFVLPQAYSFFIENEIAAMEEFVLDGGGLLIVGDDFYSSYTSLTEFAGITWEPYQGWQGTTRNITPHKVTTNISEVYCGYPVSKLLVTSQAQGVIRDGATNTDTMLAVSEVGAGRVIALADEDTISNYAITYSDNQLLANNMIDWLVGPIFEHELTVRLECPSYLRPGGNSLLNATVLNQGPNNESNVELLLLIDNSIVNATTITELVNGSTYTISYYWTPMEVTTYNVTAHVSPLVDENITINNIKVRFVSVHYPLINPVEGQYVNYSLDYYNISGSPIGTGQWNFTYDHYIDLDRIRVEFFASNPYGYNYTGWMTVNIMNRYVEEGVWQGLWYPAWIETEVSIGSMIKLLNSNATVSGRRIVDSANCFVDSWETYLSAYGFPYSFWHDRASGLWTKLESVNPLTGERTELLLSETNVRIGSYHEHDIGVNLDSPTELQLGDTSVVNATVFNLGESTEAWVNVHILINSSIVANETIASLAKGTVHLLSYQWTPTMEGICNVTAYAPTVSWENDTINNVAKRLVSTRHIRLALISDSYHLFTITSILDHMEIGYHTFPYNEIYSYTSNLSLLQNYETAVLYKGGRTLTYSEYSTLQDYLLLGGRLLVTGVDCIAADTRVADLVRSLYVGDNVGEPDLLVVDSVHPITNGPYSNFATGHHIHGLFADCDHARADSARGAITIATLADLHDKIIATEGLPGKVVFWNGDGALDWTRNPDCQAMFKNLVHWFIFAHEHELAVSLESPAFVDPGSSTTLRARIRNNGVNNETNVNLQLLVNETAVENATIAELPTSTSHTINFVWIPPSLGKYNVTAYAPPVEGENNTANNAYSKIVTTELRPKILAYIEYTDAAQDYPNTMKAIESTFGPNYALTELASYMQLDSMIAEKNVLLIPDQEYASLSALHTIGETWTDTLAEFLQEGGIIIVCDGGWNGGSGYGILTGSGLMSVAGTSARTGVPVYLTDLNDTLASGVSSVFTGPLHTVSFFTGEDNVVVDDSAYPVVIHKRVGRGHVVLLGFDYESSSNDTQALLGNAVAQAITLTIAVDPTMGSPGNEVFISGSGATSNGTLAIYWEHIFVANTTANWYGAYLHSFAVPSDASAGVRTIAVIDTLTNRTSSATFRVATLSLTPSRGSVGTKTTIRGAGFINDSKLEICFNDAHVGYAEADNLGSFEFVFNAPLSEAGPQIVKIVEPTTTYVSAVFVVLDTTPLSVNVDVGSIHFRGEVAEFYAQTAFKGQAVNALIDSVTLYKPDGSFENLTTQNVTLGLYKFEYTVPGDAEHGMYTLVIAANYTVGDVQSVGTSFKSFLISPTLSGAILSIQEIQGSIATVVIPNFSMIKANLTAIEAHISEINESIAVVDSSLGTMQASLEVIHLKIMSVNETTAIIHTDLGVMKGTVASVNNNLATIVIPGIGTITQDISGFLEAERTWIIPQSIVITILALVAAMGSVIAVLLLKKKATAEHSTNKP